MKFDLFSTIESFLADQREHILLWIPVFMAVGSALFFSFMREPSPWVVAGGFSGATFLCAAAFRLYAWRHDVGALLLFVVAWVLWLVMSGFTLATIKTDSIATPMITRETRPVMINATLDHREEQEGKKGTLLFLSDVTIEKWDKEKTPTRIRLTTRKETMVKSGDTIKVLAKLSPLSPPVAPDSYDFARHYFYDSIGALGFVLSDVVILSEPPLDIFHLESLRTHIAEKIKSVVPERQAGIVAALMTGERAAIFDEDWDALRASGLAHIISISGLHVAMVAAPVFFLVRFFLALFPFIVLRYPIKKIAAGVAMLVCCLYVGLVVPSVPTTRALLMTGIGLLAIMLDRSPFSLRLVAFSAILVLIFAPESIWSVSFQMSFAAVTALVAVAEAMTPVMRHLYADAGWFRKTVLFFCGIIMTSLVASVATAPYSIYHFQQIASYSVLANALSTPLSGLIIMPMVIVSFLLMPFGAADWSLKLLGWGVEGLLDIARWTQGLSGSVLTLPALPTLAMVMITVAGIAVILLHRRTKYSALVPLCIAILSVVTAKQPDILVNQDGSMMAIRDGHTVYVSSLRKDKFSLETWLKRWNILEEHVQPFPKQGQVVFTKGGFIACDSALCRIEIQNKKIAFGHKYYELQQDCAWADMLVTELRLPHDFCGAKDIRIFDHYYFKAHGAASFRLDKGIDMRSVRRDGEHRVWMDKESSLP